MQIAKKQLYKSILWPFDYKLLIIKNVRIIWDSALGISLWNDNDEYFGFAIKHNKEVDVINKYINHFDHNKRIDEKGEQYDIDVCLQDDSTLTLRLQAITIEICHLNYDETAKTVSETKRREVINYWICAELNEETRANIALLPRNIYALGAKSGITQIENYYKYLYGSELEFASASYISQKATTRKKDSRGSGISVHSAPLDAEPPDSLTRPFAEINDSAHKPPSSQAFKISTT